VSLDKAVGIARSSSGPPQGKEPVSRARARCRTAAEVHVSPPAGTQVPSMSAARMESSIVNGGSRDLPRPRILAGVIV